MRIFWTVLILYTLVQLTINSVSIPFSVAADMDTELLDRAAKFGSVFQFAAVFVSIAALGAIIWQLLGQGEANDQLAQKLDQLADAASEIDSSLNRLDYSVANIETAIDRNTRAIGQLVQPRLETCSKEVSEQNRIIPPTSSQDTRRAA